MESKNFFWSLFNEQTDRQIDGLTFTQISGFLDSLPRTDLINWLAWHEGAPSWKPVGQFPELLETTREPRPSRPKPPNPHAKDDSKDGAKVRDDKKHVSISESAPLSENTGSIPVFELDAAIETMRIDNKAHQDNRLNRRFQLKWTIGVYANNAWVKNETTDVSLGGVKLRDDLPSGLSGKVIARLLNPNGEQVDITCTVMNVLDRRSNRLRFQMNQGQEETLRTWLLRAHDDA